jgi:hypothetical protein
MHHSPPGSHACAQAPQFDTSLTTATQAAPQHAWTPEHAAAPPQRQAPPVPQRSLRAVSQVVHAVPPAPQVGQASPPTQLLPWQQPLGHVLTSQHGDWKQWQLAPSHRAPSPQAPPPPQRHSPATQASAVGIVVSQGVHEPPAAPHRETEGTTHSAPSQHPSGQVVASQTQVPAPAAPAQRWPVLQGPPVVPHTHRPAASQPSVRAESHREQLAPARPHVGQRCRHSNPSQQPSAQVLMSQHGDWVQTHCSAAHRWLGPQAAVSPQRHSPSMQASAPGVVVSHGTHAAPPTPQCSRVEPTHSPARQHPARQPATSHGGVASPPASLATPSGAPPSAAASPAALSGAAPSESGSGAQAPPPMRWHRPSSWHS